MRLSTILFALLLSLVHAPSAVADDGASTSAASNGPLTFGGGVSSVLLLVPNFVVAHLGCDLGRVASVNGYFGAGPNLDDTSDWMFRPGLQLRLYPIGDNRGGLYLGPDARVWTGSGDTHRQLGGRLGGLLPTQMGFDVEASLAAFHTFDFPKAGERDAQDALFTVASVTGDVWMVWRF